MAHFIDLFLVKYLLFCILTNQTVNPETRTQNLFFTWAGPVFSVEQNGDPKSNTTLITIA